MVIELDESQHRRLLLAKMVLTHGLYHASLRDQLSRMLSILHFDGACEVLLRLLADISKEKYSEDAFSQVLGNARKAFTDITGSQALTDENEIVELHKVRNRVQHGAIVVDQSTVDRFKTTTEHFISTTLHGVWGKTIAQVSVGGMIHNDELRTMIVRAETHFDKAEFLECINVCEDALIKATFDTGDVIGKAGMLTGYWGARIVKKMIDKKRYISRFKGSTKKLAAEVSDAVIEIGRIATSMQFLDNFRGDFLRHRATMTKMDKMSQQELRDAAMSCLDFVTNLLLKWQIEGILE